MKFLIKRTSDFTSSKRPCSSAYQDGVGMYGNPKWFVKIESINDLIRIIQETDCPVIVDEYDIEIYDDDRE